jgi:anti-anti-sigma regulatory factor
MEILVATANGRVPVTVLTMSGQLNAETAPQLQAEAEKVIKAGARHLLLDLREVPYVSSAGMRVLAYLLVVLRKWSDEERDPVKHPPESSRRSPYLKLLGPSPEVQRALTMVGFDLFLDIYGDHDAALRAF